MPKKVAALNGGSRGQGKTSATASRSNPKRGRAANSFAPRLKIKVMIYPAEEGGFWAQVPALPGCITEGDTREELLANLREALQGYLLATSGAFEPEPGGSEEEIEL